MRQDRDCATLATMRMRERDITKYHRISPSPLSSLQQAGVMRLTQPFMHQGAGGNARGAFRAINVLIVQALGEGSQGESLAGSPFIGNGLQGRLGKRILPTFLLMRPRDGDGPRDRRGHRRQLLVQGRNAYLDIIDGYRE